MSLSANNFTLSAGDKSSPIFPSFANQIQSSKKLATAFSQLNKQVANVKLFKQFGQTLTHSSKKMKEFVKSTQLFDKNIKTVSDTSKQFQFSLKQSQRHLQVSYQHQSRLNQALASTSHGLRDLSSSKKSPALSPCQKKKAQEEARRSNNAGNTSFSQQKQNNISFNLNYSNNAIHTSVLAFQQLLDYSSSSILVFQQNLSVISTSIQKLQNSFIQLIHYFNQQTKAKSFSFNSSQTRNTQITINQQRHSTYISNQHNTSLSLNMPIVFGQLNQSIEQNTHQNLAIYATLIQLNQAFTYSLTIIMLFHQSISLMIQSILKLQSCIDQLACPNSKPSEGSGDGEESKPWWKKAYDGFLKFIDGVKKILDVIKSIIDIIKDIIEIYNGIQDIKSALSGGGGNDCCDCSGGDLFDNDCDRKKKKKKKNTNKNNTNKKNKKQNKQNKQTGKKQGTGKTKGTGKRSKSAPLVNNLVNNKRLTPPLRGGKGALLRGAAEFFAGTIGMPNFSQQSNLASANEGTVSIGDVASNVATEVAVDVALNSVDKLKSAASKAGGFFSKMGTAAMGMLKKGGSMVKGLATGAISRLGGSAGIAAAGKVALKWGLRANPVGAAISTAWTAYELIHDNWDSITGFFKGDKKEEQKEFVDSKITNPILKSSEFNTPKLEGALLNSPQFNHLSVTVPEIIFPALELPASYNKLSQEPVYSEPKEKLPEIKPPKVLPAGKNYATFSAVPHKADETIISGHIMSPVTNQNIQIEVHPSPGMDENKVAERAMELFKQQTERQYMPTYRNAYGDIY